MVILEDGVKPGTFLVKNAPKSLNDKIRFAIPSSGRLFTDNGWIVNKGFISQVEHWLKYYNLKYTALTKPTNKEEYYKVLHLTPDAPDFIVDAVWKALARKYHPDTLTGDNNKFLEIKEAFEKIRG